MSVWKETNSLTNLYLEVAKPVLDAKTADKENRMIISLSNNTSFWFEVVFSSSASPKTRARQMNPVNEKLCGIFYSSHEILKVKEISSGSTAQEKHSDLPA